MVNMINRKGKWSGCRYICSEDNSAWLFNTVTDEVTQALTHFGLYHPVHFFFVILIHQWCQHIRFIFAFCVKAWICDLLSHETFVEHPLYITIRSIIADTAERIRYSPLMKQWWQPMLLQDRTDRLSDLCWFWFARWFRQAMIEISQHPHYPQHSVHSAQPVLSMNY